MTAAAGAVRALPGAVAVAAASVAFGAVVATRPGLAAGLLGIAGMLALAFVAPVAHLTLLLLVAALVPYDLQNSYGVGGGVDSPGLIATDVLLATGVLRAGIVLSRTSLGGRRLFAVGITLLFLLLAVLQAWHGYAAGHDVSAIGVELRALLGFATVFIAIPLLRDETCRTRLLKALLAVGLGLGAYGVLQWLGGFEPASAGDFGVRAPTSDSTAGQGQLQGGLYLFPLGVVAGFSVLVSGTLTTFGGRFAVVVMTSLNAVALLLTYERTFWLAAVVGCIFVALRAGRVERMRAAGWAVVLLALLLPALAVVAPSELSAARERLLSLGQYSSDNSVRTRVEESRNVIEKVESRPIVGSGLADTIYWGQLWNDVSPEFQTYAHNGYLWTAWKLGIPAALLLVLLMVVAIWWRGPPARADAFAAVRLGGQGALLVLVLGSVTFSPVNDGSVTPMAGLFVAMAAMPVPVSRRTG